MYLPKLNRRVGNSGDFNGDEAPGVWESRLPAGHQYSGYLPVLVQHRPVTSSNASLLYPLCHLPLRHIHPVFLFKGDEFL